MGTTAQITALSVGVSAGKVTEEHTRRVYCPYSADPALSARNVHVVDPHWDDSDNNDPIISYRDQVNYIFQESILEYNQRQKRKDRQKDPDGYYDELIREGSQITPVYSYVIQFGNRDVCGTCDSSFDYDHYKSLAANERSEYALEHENNSELHDTCVDMLTRIGEEFHDRYPHLEVLAAVIHDDEPCGTPHLTIDVCPVATGYKRGMRERCGMSRALAQMGFETGDKHAPHHYSIVNFQNDIKSWIENEIMADEGLTRQYMDNFEPHRDVHEFAAWKRQQEKEQAQKQAEAEANVSDIEPEYTRKNVAEELDTVPELTEAEALTVDLDAQIQTQQAQLAALVAEREREEDEKEQRKQKHAKMVEEQQDEIDRLRAEAASLREELADGHAILERLTRPILAFADWFCDKVKPAARGTWHDRFERWIGAYESDLSREFGLEDPNKPAPEWHSKGTTFGGQFQAGQYLR